MEITLFEIKTIQVSVRYIYMFVCVYYLFFIFIDSAVGLPPIANIDYSAFDQ